MMVRKIFLGLLLTGFILSVRAQEIQGKYFGIQGNQLIRQILNFSNTSTAINNPYLLTYSVNNERGVGGSFGLGYSFAETADGDAITKRVTTTSDLFLRAGVEKKSTFGNRFILAVGGDLVFERLNTETKVTDNFSGTIKTSNTNSGWGLGPRVAIYYAVTDKFLISTEANYYLKFIKSKFEANPGTKQEEDTKKFQLNLPTAIFLILKF